MMVSPGAWNTEEGMHAIQRVELPYTKRTVSGSGEFCAVYVSLPYGLVLQKVQFAGSEPAPR